MADATTKSARARLAGAIALGVVAILTVPRAFTSDGLVRWRELMQWLRHGVAPQSHYSMVGPIFAAPLAYVDILFGQSPGVISYYNCVLFFAGVTALWKLLEPELGQELMLRFTGILVFGSMFPAHTENFYGEVFTAMGLGVGTAAIAVGRPWLGVILLSLGAANSPAALVPLALMMVVQAWRDGKARWLFLPLMPIAIALLENRLRRAGFFVTGYEGDHGARNVLPYSGLPGFSYPFFLGVFSILFSFGKGLAYFTPGLVVPLAQSTAGASTAFRRVLGLWLAGVVGLVLVYSKWWDWSGDEFWGPRFFLFCSLPASLALAWWLGEVRGRARTAFAIGILALSFWVGLDGLIFGEHRMDACYASDGAWIFLCWYSPEFSALARPFVSPRLLGAKEIIISAIWAIGFLSLTRPVFGRLRKR